ncbi:MAG: restriction endonuclease subunit S [Pseudomonadales bacterium]|nr:restriction endonuclease subunit S [Pseudomonadales bacterium]
MTLPRGWTSRRFDQLGELCSGSTPSSSRTEFWDGATVWVTPTDLSRLNTPYLHDSAKLITERGLRSCSARLLPPGSIVLSSRAPIGYVAIPTVPFCTNQGCKSIALHNSYHSEFVYYAVTATVPRLKRLGEGTTFAEISKKSLAKAEVVLPIDKAEQSKIAEVLSTVDRAIEQTEALIAKQKRIKTGLMQDLLTRGIDEHGNLRSEQTHDFKDSPLGRIPVEWDPVPFGACGQWYSGGTPSKAVQRFWGGGVPWVCPKDMKQFELCESIDTITKDAVAAGARLVPTGTVFIVIRGMILAHTFPVGISTTEVAFNQDVKAITPKQNFMGRYLAYWLSSNSHQFLKLATTATHGTKRFDLDELQAASIGFPTLDEQRLIVSILDEQQSIIQRLQGLTAKLQAEKRGLMQDLLTGKRRVMALLGQREGVTA